MVDKEGHVVLDKSGQAKLLHADQDIRFCSLEPFPLYPGEELVQPVAALNVVMANSALRLKSVLDFEDDNGYKRIAGDEWLFEGPGTYLPRKEVVIEGTIHATVIRPNQAIKLSARKECIDRDGNPRVTGEEWIIKKTGAYLPGPYEEVVDIVNAYVLTEKKALHMRALKTFKDDFGIVRKNGEEWLIKMTDTETHIPSVYEEVVEVVNITTLTNRQYAVILDPVDKDGKPQLGRKKLVKGESSFFLMPGERLEKGIQNILLGEDEGLVLEAIEVFKDGDAVHRPGDRWMIRGPIEYVPPVEVEVVMKRRTIPLDEDEGVYVRNIRTGKVRAVIGETYMLNQDEELWKKVLPPAVESLLREDPLAVHSLATTRKPPPRRGEAEVRDKTRVITYWVPHNAAVQIYDYKKTARVVFGPELVMLGPKEQFTQINLSGGLPKKPNQIHSLVLLLGPDCCTDIIVVETADHARLQLELSYHWHFDSKDKKNAEEAAKLFSVPDFIGVACKILASRIRNAVIAVQFDEFFKNSMKIIRSSVFDLDEHGKMCDKYIFLQNQFCITSIDMQSMEPVDQRTKVALQKSMQLAIEVTPSSQSISPHGIEQQLRVAKEAVDLPLIDINLPQGLEHLKTLTQSMLQSDEIRDLFIEMMEHAEKKFDGNLIPRQVEVVESKKLDESKQFGLCNLTAGGKTKFIINVSAILCDCVRSQPKSQQIHLLFCITVVHELCHLMLRQSFRLSKTPEHFMNKAGTRDLGALAERRLFSQTGCTYNGIDLIHECEGWLNRDVNYHSAELGSKETGRILSASYVTDLLHSGKWHPPTKQDIMSLKASKTKYVVSRGEDYSSPLFNIRGVCGHMVTQENEEELPLSPHLCLFKNMGTADGTQHNGTLTHSSALATSGVAGSIGDDDQGGVYTNFVDSPMD